MGAGNWRVLILMSSFPGLMAFLISFYFLDESPRYLLVMGDFVNSRRIIEEIIVQNDEVKLDLLGEGNWEKVVLWAEHFSHKNERFGVGNIKMLFEEENSLTV